MRGKDVPAEGTRRFRGFSEAAGIGGDEGDAVVDVALVFDPEFAREIVGWCEVDEFGRRQAG